MSDWQFWVAFAVGWLALAVVVGLLVGRIIRYRNAQTPTDTDEEPELPRPDHRKR